MKKIFSVQKREKIKQLYNSGAIHVMAGTFATKFVAFFGSIVVVRLMDKEEYGLLSYVDNIYSYAFIFAGLGLVSAVLRFLVLAEKKEDKKSYFDFILKNSLIRDGVIAIIMVTAGLLLPFPDNYVRVKYLIPIVALLLPFQDLVNVDLYTIRSFFENKLYAYLAFGSSFILILGRILGAYIGGVAEVLWSRVILNGFFALIFLALIKGRFFKGIKANELPAEKKKEVNLFAIQFMITDGLWAVFMLNDTFMLGQLLNDPTRLADYKVACVLPGNISIFASAIGIFVAPYFTKNEHNRKWIRENYIKVLIVTASVIGLVAGTIGIFAAPLIRIMYGESYLNVVTLMRALLVGSFINSGIRFVSANILSALGEVKYNLIVSGIGIVLQLVLDAVLIPIIGEMAVAVVNCLIYLFMSITLIVVVAKKYYNN